MDELIEHLQINLGKDFGYEDDVVVEKLRDIMHELRSSRLDHAGNYLFVEIRFVGIYVSSLSFGNIFVKFDVMKLP